MRVIYRGEPQCPCIYKLNWWFTEDRSRIDADALVECDCGQRWYFRVPRTGQGHTWERDETCDIVV